VAQLRLVLEDCRIAALLYSASGVLPCPCAGDGASGAAVCVMLSLATGADARSCLSPGLHSASSTL
jgi:hypothetical protein